jgi:hypothetical protein
MDIKVIGPVKDDRIVEVAQKLPRINQSRRFGHPGQLAGNAVLVICHALEQGFQRLRPKNAIDLQPFRLLKGAQCRDRTSPPYAIHWARIEAQFQQLRLHFQNIDIYGHVRS